MAKLDKLASGEHEMEKRFSFWFDKQLAHHNNVMTSDASTNCEKWIASAFAVGLMHAQVFLCGVLPVVVTAWLLSKMQGEQAKSWHFLISMLPYPFLVLMLYASIFVTIDSERHKMWTVKQIAGSTASVVFAELAQVNKAKDGAGDSQATGPGGPEGQEAGAAGASKHCNCGGEASEDGTIVILPEPVAFPPELKRTCPHFAFLTIVFLGATAWLG